MTVNIDNRKISRLVDYFLLQSETEVFLILKYLRKSLIHNDDNDNNILVDCDEERPLKVSGLIDFGDMVYSYTVFELAVALAYAMFDTKDQIQTASFYSIPQIIDFRKKDIGKNLKVSYRKR